MKILTLIYSKAGVNEKFALIAYTGPYQALNDVAICGFIKCTVNGLCSGLTMNSNTFFTYFSVSANFGPNYHLYPLFAGECILYIGDNDVCSK